MNLILEQKPQYNILNGLRGVAALLVVWYHVFEGYAFAGNTPIIQTINHGYLAVDFFFMLSGFVISYAYDERWTKSLTLKNFFKRRLIRLHPLVILGAVIGAITFCIQGSVQWDGTKISTSLIMLSMVLTMFLFPALPGTSYEVRGNGEMYPLNGPSWSLFFEYIGNILYALFIRRFSNKILTIWTILLGIGLGLFIMFDISGYGSIGVGWTIDNVNFLGGSLRMLFPFSLGMLLSRNFRPTKVKGAFWICSLLLVVLFHVPYLEPQGSLNWNGVFELFCIAIVFPTILWLGASGSINKNGINNKICTFLGDISYPIYIIHYPFMYLFYSWLIDKQLYTFGETWQVALLVFAGNIVLAYICLKYYDEPIRKWLNKKF
ncbi:MAG: acyltransferase [Rikenellaceae bacterium]